MALEHGGGISGVELKHGGRIPGGKRREWSCGSWMNVSGNGGVEVGWKLHSISGMLDLRGEFKLSLSLNLNLL